MIFKNMDSDYPIRGIEDKIPGVCYRTGSKSWIYWRLMTLWVQERRELSTLNDERKRDIFLDKCVGHDMTPELKLARD